MVAAQPSSSFKVFFVVLSTAHFFFHVSSNFTAEFSVESIHSEARLLRHSVPPRKDLIIKVFKSERMYLGAVFIGSGGYEVHAVLVTSNSVNRFLCYPCGPCFQNEHRDNIFVPIQSASYEKVTCINNTYCNSVGGKGCDDNNKCTFDFHNDGFYIRGTLSQDRLRLRINYGTIVNREFIFGCIHRANGRINQHAEGTIGLGRHQLSLVRQLGAEVFSYCLPNTEEGVGWVEFGAAVRAPHLHEAITTPLVAGVDNNIYYVNIHSFTVEGGEPIVIADKRRGIFSVDTGEPNSFVDTDTMISLNKSIQQVVPYPPVSNPPFQLCFDATSEPNDPRLPWIQVRFFEGGSILLYYRYIFLRQSGTDTWCFTFIAGDQSILGSQTQMGGRIVFDLANNKIIFDKKGDCI